MLEVTANLLEEELSVFIVMYVWSEEDLIP